MTPSDPAGANLAGRPPTTSVELISELSRADLNDLCDAAEAAIEDGGGFGWLTPPERHVMETYWKGVLLVPERQLYVARLDGTICGSAQLQRAPRNNEAQALAATLTTFFIAPWARGHGLARQTVETVEQAARDLGLAILNLDVRDTQKRAIQIYEGLGFTRWGTHPYYACVNGDWHVGHYYVKNLKLEGPGDFDETGPAETGPAETGPAETGQTAPKEFGSR